MSGRAAGMIPAALAFSSFTLARRSRNTAESPRRKDDVTLHPAAMRRRLPRELEGGLFAADLRRVWLRGTRLHLHGSCGSSRPSQPSCWTALAMDVICQVPRDRTS